MEQAVHGVSSHGASCHGANSHWASFDEASCPGIENARRRTFLRMPPIITDN
jgi:hypothetical protein